MKTTRQFQTSHRNGLCCPFKGYKGETVFAVIRVSETMRFIFADGRTLTTAPKTRYATFPRTDHPENALEEAKAELAEKHPLTRNLYVEINDEAFKSVSTLDLVTA